MYEVHFYRDANGNQPVKEYLDKLEEKSVKSKDARIKYNKKQSVSSSWWVNKKHSINLVRYSTKTCLHLSSNIFHTVYKFC